MSKTDPLTYNQGYFNYTPLGCNEPYVVTEDGRPPFPSGVDKGLFAYRVDISLLTDRIFEESRSEREEGEGEQPRLIN